MRLLDTTTLQLHEFVADIPPYAVLSHTWESDELTYQDLRQLSCDDTPSTPSAIRGTGGYAKVTRFCAVARTMDGLRWAWADTCCIDKTSSAELSEAINSMYAWYARATVCYVYLADVDAQAPSWERSESLWEPMLQSRWFTRGWTLQELVAPKAMAFFARDWSDLGSRLSLEALLLRRTGIPRQVLRGMAPTHCSAAERMSWAAERQTTREEDAAYCLMGLFDVHMPLLYGEGGRRAFMRLQEEIWKRVEDYSLLLWHDRENSIKGVDCSILAPHPKCFRIAAIPWMVSPTKEVPVTKHKTISSWAEVRRTRPSEESMDLFLQDPDWYAQIQHPYLRSSSSGERLSLPLDLHAGGSIAPAITARGMSLFMPLTRLPSVVQLRPSHAADHGGRAMLAWTYCRWSKYYICMILRIQGEQAVKSLRKSPSLVARRQLDDKFILVMEDDVRKSHWYSRNVFVEIYPEATSVTRALRADEECSVMVQFAAGPRYSIDQRKDEAGEHVDNDEKGLPSGVQLEGWFPSNAQVGTTEGEQLQQLTNRWTSDHQFPDLKAGVLFSLPSASPSHRSASSRDKMADARAEGKDTQSRQEDRSATTDRVWILVGAASHSALDHQDFGPQVCCVVRDVTPEQEYPDQGVNPKTLDRARIPRNACDGIASDRSAEKLRTGHTVVGVARRTQREVSHVGLWITIHEPS